VPPNDLAQLRPNREAGWPSAAAPCMFWRQAVGV